MKPSYVFFFIVVSIFLSSKCNSQEFIFSENCKEAYKNFLSMKVVEGKKILTKEIISNKKNILPFILINYEDLILLTLNENPSEYKAKSNLLEKRLEIVENGNKNSPYYLFSKALLYFQWSLIKIKYADYWDATWNFRKSFLLFKENKKKFPTFPYNNIFLGLQESVISTIPNGYKWASSILGLKGNMKNGMSLLKNFITTNDPLFKEESQLYYIYLKNYLENDVEGANQLISLYKLDVKNNQLFAFMAANLAINNKKAQIAESILTQRTKSNEYANFPLLDYELADAKMKRLDFSCIPIFQKFINNTKGNFYVKDANYSIALCYYLQNDTKQANSYMGKVITTGKTESDADKQALKNAKKGTFPSVFLLKARLLNDGGYNKEALKILESITVNSLKTPAERLEYIYRFGRIFDDLDLHDKALEYYNKTIELGISSTEYFAARAALQAGYIYEKKGMKQKAIEYYEKTLAMDDHEFKNSLDQRAKSSLNRLR